MASVNELVFTTCFDIILIYMQNICNNCSNTILYTVKPIYSRHLGTRKYCPDYRGVLISECPDYRGVHISECPQ